MSGRGSRKLRGSGHFVVHNAEVGLHYEQIYKSTWSFNVVNNPVAVARTVTTAQGTLPIVDRTYGECIKVFLFMLYN